MTSRIKRSIAIDRLAERGLVRLFELDQQIRATNLISVEEQCGIQR